MLLHSTCRHRSDLASAEAALRHLISPKVNPKHTAGMQQLARVLIDSKKNDDTVKGVPDEALDLYERVMAVLRDVSTVSSSRCYYS
jgi:hypothetical protein